MDGVVDNFSQSRPKIYDLHNNGVQRADKQSVPGSDAENPISVIFIGAWVHVGKLWIRCSASPRILATGRIQSGPSSVQQSSLSMNLRYFLYRERCHESSVRARSRGENRLGMPRLEIPGVCIEVFFRIKTGRGPAARGRRTIQASSLSATCPVCSVSTSIPSPAGASRREAPISWRYARVRTVSSSGYLLTTFARTIPGPAV